jgi:hypothetical protein
MEHAEQRRTDIVTQIMLARDMHGSRHGTLQTYAKQVQMGCQQRSYKGRVVAALAPNLNSRA